MGKLPVPNSRPHVTVLRPRLISKDESAPVGVCASISSRCMDHSCADKKKKNLAIYQLNLLLPIVRKRTVKLIINYNKL